MGGKGKGGGKSWTPVWTGFAWGGKGKGKSKGKSLKSFDPSVKVWIGSVPEDATWKELQAHMDQAGKTKWVEVFKGKSAGTAAAAYSTAEEASAAIAALNGSVLKSSAIVCDVWEKKEKAA